MNENEDTVDAVIGWDQYEMEVLAMCLDKHKVNRDIPSPILRDYQWTGIYKPMEHQRTTASFLSIRRRAFCFNEAGTGKTSAALWAADYLMKQGLVKRVLVICPVSIMYTAWQDEVFKSVMHLSCGVAHGSKTKRAKVIGGDYEIVVINYDGVGLSLIHI